MPKSTNRPMYTVIRNGNGGYAVTVELVGKPKLIVSGFDTKGAAEAWIDGEQRQTGSATASRPKTTP
jgi:hypothetical protein